MRVVEGIAGRRVDRDARGRAHLADALRQAEPVEAVGDLGIAGEQVALRRLELVAS